MTYDFYTGSYGKAEEPGITHFRLDGENGTLEQADSFGGIANPSYLAWNHEKNILYAVEEQAPEGRIFCLTERDGKLAATGSMSTEGAAPCHICIGKKRTQVYVSNYTSGSLAVFGLKEDGTLDRRIQLLVHEGKGQHPVRQEGPHIHCCMEESGSLYVSDLGLDRVFQYEIQGESGLLYDSGEGLALPGGAGPRHLLFGKQERLAYVVCELSNQAAVFQRGENGWNMLQLLSTLPDGFSGFSKASAIKMEKNHVFISNRGHDSIAVFRILEDGLLALTGIYPSGGKTPRDIEVFGDWLISANQESDSLTVFRIDWESGALIPARSLAGVKAPTCIAKRERRQYVG